MTSPISEENIEQQFPGLLQGCFRFKHPQLGRRYVSKSSVHGYHTVGKDLQRWEIKNSRH